MTHPTPTSQGSNKEFATFVAVVGVPTIALMVGLVLGAADIVGSLEWALKGVVGY